MKKIISGLLLLAMPSLLFAQMVVTTKDGKTYTLAVKASDILKIEFKDAANPVTTVPSPFVGKWARKDGNNIVEYMEIQQGTGQFDVLFREKPEGPVTSRIAGQLQNGELSGKGSTRLISMRMNNQQQVEYKSTDFDGKKPWTCTWFRVN